MRCFPFHDFQFAPTLEEFERILGCSLKDHNPLTSLGEKTTSELMEVAGSLEIREVATNMENKGKFKGFQEDS